MKLLTEITNENIGLINKRVSYNIRRSARAILFHDMKVALLYVSKNEYHKLPGGGIKDSEDKITALKREILEETGCEAKIITDVGTIIEYRDNENLKQFSYCFLAKRLRNLNAPSFTEKERNLGFKLKWMEMDEAIKVLENDNPKDYDGRFIVLRDLTFLKKAQTEMKDWMD